MRYTVVLAPESDEGGYSVWVPALPGVFTQGDTRAEALANAQEIIRFHRDCLEAEGEEIPHETAAPELEGIEV
jgi:predicted RNase H-like HicB family nuclease